MKEPSRTMLRKEHRLTWTATTDPEAAGQRHSPRNGSSFQKQSVRDTTGGVGQELVVNK